MKRPSASSIVLLLIFTIANIAILSNGQSKVAAPADKTPLELIKTDHRIAGSFSVLSREKVTIDTGVKYLFRNVADKPIQAYSVVIANGEDRSLYISIDSNSQTNPGEIISSGYLFSTDDAPAFELDFVLFTDGSGWGSDVYGGSNLFVNYIKGRETAIDRVAELVGDESRDLILHSVKREYHRSWGNKIPDNINRDERSQFMTGYNEIVSLLDYGNEQAKLIGAKLRAMESKRH